MSILIKNGIVVTASKKYATDLLIVDDKIVEIGQIHPDHSPSTEVIDAHGKFIFPGGIDPHVHMHLPTIAGLSADDFHSGSIAALFGGTTTFIDFVTPKKNQPLVEAFRQRLTEAKSSVIDYSFHMSPVEWRPSIPGEIEACVKEGITSFKVYMAYLDTVGLSEDDLLKVMKVVSDNGQLITVHCEFGREVDRAREALIKNGHTTPAYHPVSRPATVESEAVKRAIDLAKEAGCPLYIVHVSTGNSLRHIHKAQNNGQKVFAETCPQYLLLDDSKYRDEFNTSAAFVMSPPLRKKEDSIALWQALAEGHLQTIGTDHCSFTLKQKRKGIKDFTLIPNGAGGVEHRLPLMYTYGVLAGRLTIHQFVDLVSTQPAKIFGLYPKKGTIEVGSDADLVIWDSEMENIISAKTHHQNCDINIYEGLKTVGSPEYVIKGGKVAIRMGKLIAPELKGNYLGGLNRRSKVS